MTPVVVAVAIRRPHGDTRAVGNRDEEAGTADVTLLYSSSSFRLSFVSTTDLRH